jgi:hypothetical protein
MQGYAHLDQILLEADLISYLESHRKRGLPRARQIAYSLKNSDLLITVIGPSSFSKNLLELKDEMLSELSSVDPLLVKLKNVDNTWAQDAISSGLHFSLRLEEGEVVGVITCTDMTNEEPGY